MVSVPRPTWTLQRGLFLFNFRHFLLASQFCNSFFRSATGYCPAQAVFRRLLCPNAWFLPDVKTPPPGCSGFVVLGLHPDIAVANRNRPIPSRMARNISFGTAISAIWKTIFREWHTALATTNPTRGNSSWLCHSTFATTRRARSQLSDWWRQPCVPWLDHQLLATWWDQSPTDRHHWCLRNLPTGRRWTAHERDQQ